MRSYNYLKSIIHFKTDIMKFFITFLIALAVFSSLLPSCKKTDDNPNPLTFDSATIMGFKDSTQLIKSIATQSYDSNGNMDTPGPPTYLYYDTLNKKIYFTTQPVTAPPTSNFFVYSYNDLGLVTAFNNYMPSDSFGASSIVYNYDPQNIFKSEITTYLDGSSDAVYMTKTSLPSGGYSLSCKSSFTNFVHDSSLDNNNFDAKGRLISKSELQFPALNYGNVDSIVYDATGNVSKVVETQLQGSSSSNTYNLFEFASRDTKGAQLSNLNAIMYNGIANLPDVEDNVDFGTLLNGFENFSLYQFTKYPSLSTKVYDYSNDSYKTFDNSPQYDSKGRLIKYKLYNGDVDFGYALEYDLTYYK